MKYLSPQLHLNKPTELQNNDRITPTPPLRPIPELFMGYLHSKAPSACRDRTETVD